MPDSPTSPPNNGNGLEQAAREFVETGMTVVYLPVSDYAAPIFQGLDFLLDDPQHSQWSFKIDRPGEPTDDFTDALIRKTRGYGTDRNGLLSDDKWYWHYRESLRRTLKEHRVPTDDHQDLLIDCGRLHTICKSLAYSFAGRLDHVLSGYNFAQLVRAQEAQDLHVLRVSKYDLGVHIGKQHTDQALITFHLAENRPGLRLGPDKIPYTAETDRVLIFAGDKMQRLTRGQIQAMAHDVVDPSNEATNRRSMVFFTHAAVQHLP